MYERFIKELAALGDAYPEAKQAEHMIEEGYAVLGALLPKYRALQGAQSFEQQMIFGMIENTRAYVNKLAEGLAATALSKMAHEDFPPARIYQAKNMQLKDDKRHD